MPEKQARIVAGGLVVFAIQRIIQAFRAMKEEAERATEAIDKQREAPDKLAEKAKERQQATEDISGLRRGPIDGPSTGSQHPHHPTASSPQSSVWVSPNRPFPPP